MHLFVRLAKSSIAAAVLGFCAANSQQLPHYPDTTASKLPAPEQVKLYNSASGLVEPVLIPRRMPPSSSDCKGAKDSGTVSFSFVIDANGNPRNVVFKQALGSDIDILALKILLDSKFQPATLDGSPVAVGRDADMNLQVCLEQEPGSAKQLLRLLSVRDEKFNDWRHAPAEVNLAPILMPADAQADHEKPGADFAPPKTITHRMFDTRGMVGSFVFGVLVDEHGIDHIEKVLKSTNPTLLPIAAGMIGTIRQTPAMKNGMPIPVHMTAGLDIGSQ